MKTFKIILAVLFLFTFPVSKAQELCKIEITSINILNSVNYPEFDIRIDGKVTNGQCLTVKVTLFCPAGRPNLPPSVEQIVTVDPVTHLWTALFEDYFCECTGNFNSSQFSVTAECTDKIKCPVSDKEAFQFRCPDPRGCPIISFVLVDIGPCKNDNATSCGYRTLTFTPTVSGTIQGFQWNFGDGTPDVSGSGTPGPITHDYLKPPVLAPKLTLFNFGCNPVSVVFVIPGITFPICDACPSDALIGFTSAIDQCHLTGTVIANYCAAQYNSCVIDFGDGDTETITDPALLNGHLIDHTYGGNGDYEVKIILQKSGENCTYSDTISITNCIGGGDDDDDEDDDSCILCICTDFWCCVFFVLFIIAMISLSISLAVALCNGNTAAWITFGISLAATILFAALLIAVCDINICALLLTIAVTNTVNWAIICGTNLIPCNSFLCQLTTLPILGIQVSNYLIGLLVIWILTFLFCAL